jgi:hypothetical protein
MLGIPREVGQRKEPGRNATNRKILYGVLDEERLVSATGQEPGYHYHRRGFQEVALADLMS